MKRILIFVGMLTSILLSGQAFGYSPSGFDLPSYSSVKRGVDNAGEDMKQLRKLRALTRRQFNTLQEAADKPATAKDLKSHATALRDVYLQSEIQRKVVAQVIEDLYRVANSDAEKFGWTPAQIAEAKKWKDKVYPEILGFLKKLNKESPSDYEIEALYEQYISS